MSTNIMSVHIDDTFVLTNFSKNFASVFCDITSSDYDSLHFVCIGTDRILGDCLGPLVGEKIKLLEKKEIKVYGTLDEPVHAKNLETVSNKIMKKSNYPFIISIDACVGKSTRVGYITVGAGALRPGAGVHKDLPGIGHMHVTGVVAIGGCMEYFMLQQTRLSLIMRMSNIIGKGIYYNVAIKKMWDNRKRGHKSICP